VLLLSLPPPPRRPRPLSKIVNSAANIYALITLVSGGMVSTEWTEDSFFIYYLRSIKSFGIFR
jgi:hypothetical protein